MGKRSAKAALLIEQDCANATERRYETYWKVNVPKHMSDSTSFRVVLRKLNNVRALCTARVEHMPAGTWTELVRVLGVQAPNKEAPAAEWLAIARTVLQQGITLLQGEHTPLRGDAELD